MTDAPMVITADALPRGFSLKQGPVTLETHRGPMVTLRVPGTMYTVGAGKTDEEALANVVQSIRWWFLRDGPRLTAPAFKHTVSTRRQLAEWRVIESLIAYDPTSP